jgi:hypothetical protein
MKTNGRDRDRGGIFGLGWGGLDLGLPPFMAGVLGPAAEPTKEAPLADFDAKLKEAAQAGDLAGKVARALLEPATATKARPSRLYRRVGAALSGKVRTKDAKSELCRRIGRAMGG